MLSSSYKRNILILNVYSILIKRVAFPILILYYLLNNLNYTQIGIIGSASAISMLIFEISGGVFADVHGRKKSLFLSSSLATITMILLYLGNSFGIFLLAGIFYGVASSFLSGTRTSLLYDTLVELKEEHKFKKYNGRMIFIAYFFNALFLLGIPVLYKYYPKIPFLIGVLFYFVAAILSLFIVEPKRIDTNETKNYKRRLFDAIGEIHLTSKIKSLIFILAITGPFAWMASDYIQPLLKIRGLDIIYFGIVYATMRMVAGFSSGITHKLEKVVNSKNLLIIGALLTILSFFGFRFGNVLWITIGAILLLKFAEGFNRILLEDELNKRIKSTNRTTILSLSSFTAQSFNASIIFIFGITADAVGVQKLFTSIVVSFSILIIIALYFFNRK